MSQGKTPPGGREGDRILEALAAWPDAPRTAMDWDETAEQVSARVAAGAKPRTSMRLSDEDILRAPLPQTRIEEESVRDFLAKEGSGPRSESRSQARERDRQSLKELAKSASATPAPAPVVPASPEDSGMITIPVLAELRGVPAAPMAPAQAVPATASSTKAQPAKEGSTKRHATWTAFGVLALAAAAAGAWLGVRRHPGAPQVAANARASPALAPASVVTGAASDMGEGVLLELGRATTATSTAAASGRGVSVLSGGGSGKSSSLVASNARSAAVEALLSAPPAGAGGSSAPAPAGSDLNSMMAAAVGVSPTASGASRAPGRGSMLAPASTQTSVPLRPSLGAVQGALGAVKPSAQACLGPDDAISHGNVTFKSDGSVASVSISGGAVGTPAEGCIRAALMKARIPPFAEDSYTSPITIRPN